MARKKGTVDYYNTLISGMDLERQSFIAHYKDLQQYISPRRGRFFEQDRNKGTKKHQNIINGAAIQALRVAVAGMLNGTMSPSRPWFALETMAPDIMDSAEVRDWLWKTELIIRSILNASNFYNMAPVFLKELLLFGTSLMTHVDDFADVSRFYTHTAGSYWLGQNDRLEIDTLGRKFEWPVIQIIKQFGLKNVSTSIKQAYDDGAYNRWYPVVHFIEPNDDFNSDTELAGNKKFSSVYYEPGNANTDSTNNKFLAKGGFDQFPAYAVRWDVTEGDIYGVDCPGMTSLGDVKQLQVEERRKAQGIDKMVNPPLSGPPPVKNVQVSGLAGGLTVYEGDDQKQKLQPIYQVEPRLQELRLDMDAVERRINNAYFNDLFLAISNMEGIQPRNQLDLSQRNEERLIQLGPVLERLHGEFLDRMIDRVFNQAVKADILPLPPEVLQGSPLRVRFISTLAMAQRSVVVNDLERFVNFGGIIGQVSPGALDKIDSEKIIDEWSKATGLPPKVVNSDEEVAAMRQQRQEDQAAAQALQIAEQGAGVIRDLGSASTEEGTALGDITGVLDEEQL
jgi:hypothetical protein